VPATTTFLAHAPHRNGQTVNHDENEFNRVVSKGGETEDVKKVVENSKEKWDPKK